MELKKYNQNVKPGMKAKVSATDQFLCTLVGSELAPQKQWLHGCFIHQSPQSPNILSHGHIFYFGRIVIWLSKNQVLETIPETFKTTYPSTGCIKDCTKMYYQKPSLLSFQRSLWRRYEHYTTYKGFFEITPCGAISFA